jgi:hypothetical protein
VISSTLTFSSNRFFYSFKKGRGSGNDGGKVISVERAREDEASELGENTLIPIIISDHTKSLMSQEKIKHVHTEERRWKK